MCNKMKRRLVLSSCQRRFDRSWNSIIGTSDLRRISTQLQSSNTRAFREGRLSHKNAAQCTFTKPGNSDLEQLFFWPPSYLLPPSSERKHSGQKRSLRCIQRTETRDFLSSPWVPMITIATGHISTQRNDRDRLLTGRFLWIFYTKTVRRWNRDASNSVWTPHQSALVRAAVCFRYSVQYFVEKLMKFDDYHGSNLLGHCQPTPQLTEQGSASSWTNIALAQGAVKRWMD